MNKSITVLAVASVFFLACSCVFPVQVGGGKTVRCKGPVVEKALDLKDFKSVVINGSCDISLIQQDRFLVNVRANEEVFDYLDYHVENGVLYLETIDHVNIMAQDHDVTIGLPSLVKLTVNGAADADLKGGLSSREDLAVEVNGAGDIDMRGLEVPVLRITVNGAGDIDLNGIDVEEISISVNGAGDAKVSGKAGKAVFSVSGVGGIDARELDCADIHTSKSGVASIRTK